MFLFYSESQALNYILYINFIYQMAAFLLSWVIGASENLVNPVLVCDDPENFQFDAD